MCFFAFPLWKREGEGIDAVIRCKKEEKTTMGRWSLLSFLSWKTTQKVRGICALEQVPGDVSV